MENFLRWEVEYNREFYECTYTTVSKEPTL